MSKLDNIIIECINDALDGNKEKLGDYVDPPKEQIKALVMGIIKDTDFAYKDASAYADVLVRKIQEL